MFAYRRAAAALLATAAAFAGGTSAAHAAGADTWANWASSNTQAHIESLDFIGPQLYAGSEGDGVFTSSNAVGPWSTTNGGLNPQHADFDVHQVVASGGTLYAATTGGLFSSAGGGNWQPVGQGSGPRLLNAAVNSIYVVSPSTLVAGTASGGVLYSSDSGAHWDKATGFPASESFFHIVASNGILYGAASDGIFVSSDAGHSWTLHSDGIPPNETVFRIAVSTFGGGNQLYASTGSDVYRSDNAGLTWNEAGGATSVPGTFLPTGAKRGLFLAGGYGASRFIVGTEFGVWATTDNGDTWGRMSSDTSLGAGTMNSQIVNTVGIGFGAYLMAGTSAHGVFSLPLSTVTANTTPALSPTSGLEVGMTVNAGNGTWGGSLPFFYTRQWKRCTNNSQVNTCTAIAGATGPTYALTAGDVGKYIRVDVSATNLLSASAATQTSTATAVVAASPADAPVPPSGFPKVGAIDKSYPWGTTFTIDPGTGWKVNGNPVSLDSVAYRWQRCDGNGANCVDIPGATSSTYTSGTPDIAKKLAGYVTATKTGASTTSYAGQTLTIIEKTPVNTAAPTVVGDAYTGSTLSSTAGGWDGHDLTYTRQWLACESDGLGCTPIINDATGPTFTITKQQLGKRMQLRVTATAFDGVSRNTDASSTPGPVVTDPPVVAVDPGGSGGTPPGGGSTPPGSGSTPPAGKTPPGGQTVPLTAKTIPAVSRPKTLKVGATLTAPKTLAGATKLAYQWYRNGKAIRKATKRTYKIVAADRGKTLQLRLTVTTAAGKKLVLKSKAIKVPKPKAKKKRKAKKR